MGYWRCREAHRNVLRRDQKKITYQTFISLCPAKPLYPPYEGILYTRCDGLSIEKIKKNNKKPGENNKKF